MNSLLFLFSSLKVSISTPVKWGLAESWSKIKEMKCVDHMAHNSPRQILDKYSFSLSTVRRDKVEGFLKDVSERDTDTLIHGLASPVKPTQLYVMALLMTKPCWVSSTIIRMLDIIKAYSVSDTKSNTWKKWSPMAEETKTGSGRRVLSLKRTFPKLPSFYLWVLTHSASPSSPKWSHTCKEWKRFRKTRE